MLKQGNVILVPEAQNTTFFLSFSHYAGSLNGWLRGREEVRIYIDSNWEKVGLTAMQKLYKTIGDFVVNGFAGAGDPQGAVDFQAFDFDVV